MSKKIILGIHVSLSKDSSSGGFIDGHAYLTFGPASVPFANHVTVGLWADEEASKRFKLLSSHGKAHGVLPKIPQRDVRFNLERGVQPSISRYYEITPEQYQALLKEIVRPENWRYTNTCAAWASETLESVIGEFLDPNDNFGFETPRKLYDSIQKIEKKQPTSLENPLPPNKHNTVKISALPSGDQNYAQLEPLPLNAMQVQNMLVRSTQENSQVAQNVSNGIQQA